ncbi:MAG: BtpA/SgcQ family protein, partial [Leptolyngbya sp.]|nr:BtpA/SgcQ family protein [Candidatus Melainabacteria bacterium]
ACAMALVVKRIMSVSDLPIGVNVLRNDALTALAVAATTGARFIRVNVLTGAMLTDQGIIEGEAHALHLYRRQLMANKDVRILADVLVKHASPLADSDIRLIAKDTVKRGLADGLIVSGTATGSAPDMSDFESVKEVLPDVPLFCGSGCTAGNITAILSVADGAIVGTSLKRQGEVSNPVDVERVRALAKAAPKG